MNPNALFANAQQDLAIGDYSSCLAKTDELLQQVGEHYSIVHLQALAHRASGNANAAQTSFARAMEIMPPPGDAFVFANFASLLVSINAFDRALHLYTNAAQLAPDNAEIQNRYCALLRGIKGDEAADIAFQSLLKRQPNPSALRHYYALFLADCGRCHDAFVEISKVTSAQPNSVSAHILRGNIALELGMAVQDQFNRLYQDRPDNADLALAFAASLARNGDPHAAVEILEVHFNRFPSDGRPLTGLIAITQQQLGFAQTDALFDRLLAKHPKNPAVTAQYCTYLWRHHSAEPGYRYLMQAGTPHIEVRELRLLEAELKSELRLFSNASAIFEHFPAHDVEARAAEMRHLLRASEYERAQEFAETLAFQHGLVEGWTMCESLWRMQGDARWHWLIGNEAFIHSQKLPNFASYRDDLIDALRIAHSVEKNHPLGQSPRGGTQTDGMLFRSGNPAILALIDDIKGVLDQYIGALPVLDAKHPLALLKRVGHRFTGSWSIRLAGQGFHKPHFHNLGRISSACYITLPDEVTAPSCAGASTLERPAWLEFGRPSPELALPVEPFQSIQPEEGMLVLFPSFLWHGTRPFSEGERLVVAFDVDAVALH